MFKELYTFEENKNLIEKIMDKFFNKNNLSKDDILEEIKKEISNEINKKIENFKLISEIQFWEKKRFKTNKFVLTHFDNNLDGRFTIKKDFENKLIVIDFYLISF